MVLIALLLALPFVEIAVMVQVADWIGTLDMVVLLLVISVGGVFIVRFQGVGAWQRIRADLQAGRVPGSSLVDGALILAAGVLLIVPGFVTDGIGLLLLLPPVRHLVRGALNRRFRVRVATSTGRGPVGPGDEIDVDSVVRGRSELDPPSSSERSPQ